MMHLVKVVSRQLQMRRPCRAPIWSRNRGAAM